MAEPASSAAAAGAAGVALAKSQAVTFLAGAIAAGLMFAVLWPRTAREGVSRIACTIAGSMLGGEPLLAYVHATFAWYPHEVKAAMLVYVISGLPAWWLLGGFARWFDKRRRQDIGQMAQDAADIVRKVRGG